MKRRSRAGGEPTKGQRRKTPEPARRNAAKVQARSKLPPVTGETEVARLTRELSDERKQRTATSEVLHLLSGLHGDLSRLFKTILTNATKLCQANFGTLSLYEGDAFRIAAMHDVPPALAELRRREPLVRAGPLLRIAQTKRLLHIADYTEYVASHPVDSDAATFAKLTGVRTMLGVPMLKEGGIVGAIVVYRQEVRAFSDRKIALLKSFAAQAVIAIENARLLNELRQRTDDLSQRTTELTEALEQQTATSDVLQVISRSPGDLEPVFASMLEKAVRICDATFGNIYRWDGEFLSLVAVHNTPPPFAEARRLPRRPNPNNIFGRMLATNAVVHIVDAAQLSKGGNREYETAVELGGVRTCLAVPMLKGHELIGSISLFRQEVRPFNDKQIASLTNFAAQAVIAIENARLLNELRQRTSDLTERTADLTEALDQQTATSEVLQVISSSPGDLEPVFQAMLENATRICEAKFGVVFSFDGNKFHFEAQVDTPPELAESNRARPMPQPLPGSHLDRLRQTKRASYTADYAAEGIPAPPVTLGGARSTVDVPMLKDNELVGAFSIYRQEVRPFTEKQIELVKNFAAQAVIAIENARLLNELRQRTSDLTEALDQQTVTSQILQAISSSTGDVQPVFEAVLMNAVRLCDAKFGMINYWNGEALYLAAAYNAPAAFVEFRKSNLLRPKPENFSSARMLMSNMIIHCEDLTVEQEYLQRMPIAVAAVELGGVRTFLAAPMFKESSLIGAVIIYRQEARPFTDKQIELLKNFAAQAAIAIENSRLLRELRELNQQLEQRVADQVGEIERMSRLRRFLPPQVADLIVASGSEKQLKSHRREITALFCDLRGFTGFTESADAEDVMALLRDYHAAIGEIIIKYNGTLERYAGDGVMVIFNDPVPVENPALQAVLMALEVRDAIGALTETWRRLGHDIGFGIGIAHGFATLGTIGFEGRFDYAAIGTVSNVASRLCDEAKPGQILISPRVLMKVENAVKVEPVGEFALKGIRRPLAAYNVVAALASKI
jgi:GAF domain-containing protein